MLVEIKRAVYEENDKLASSINAELRARGVFTVNILGSPGAGKTSLISRLAERLPGPLSVIEGDVASDIDTQALRERGVSAYQIETGGDCHLNAPMIRAVLGKFSVPDGAWLFIENIGNLICPAEFVVGEDFKLVVSSAAEGHDKPWKYPTIFARSALCVLTKLDIAEAIGFDEATFRRAIEDVAPGLPVLALNGKTGAGVEAITAWLREARRAAEATARAGQAV
jgi:hydrogenase nickel incorporation protein HypB